MTDRPKTPAQVAGIFITSFGAACRAGCTVFALRLCIGPLVPARQMVAAQCLMQPFGGVPGFPADGMRGRSQAGGAGGRTLHRCSTAHRRMPAVLVGRLVRQAVIGFPGEVHHG